MFKLKRCCFLTIKKGSVLASIYSLIYYLIMFLTKIVHILDTEIVESQRNVLNFYLTWISIVMSLFVVICSIILFVGLYYNKRWLFLPWLVAINLINIIDFVILYQLVQDKEGWNPFFFAMALVDIIIFFINIYSFLCVLVHYRMCDSNLDEQRRSSIDLQSGNISKDLLFGLTPQTLESNTLTSET